MDRPDACVRDNRASCRLCFRTENVRRGDKFRNGHLRISRSHRNVLGWFSPENGYNAAVTVLNWIGLVLVCFILPALLSFAINEILRKLGWVKDGYMKLEN